MALLAVTDNRRPVMAYAWQGYGSQTPSGESMASKDTLSAEIVEIVADIAEVEPSEVALDARLEDLGVDSLDGLRIVAAVEKRYRIVIEESEIAKIRTMPDILELVQRYRPEVE